MPYTYTKQPYDPPAGYAIRPGVAGPGNPDGVLGNLVYTGQGGDYASQEQARLNQTNQRVSSHNRLVNFGKMATAGIIGGGALGALYSGAVPAASGLASYGAPASSEAVASFGAPATIGGGITKAAANPGLLSKLGDLFTGNFGSTLVNGGLALYGMNQQNKANNQARADTLKAQADSLALQREQLEQLQKNADLDRADAKALNDKINELKARELEISEQTRQQSADELKYQHNIYEQDQARRAPARALGQQALQRLSAIWGLS